MNGLVVVLLILALVAVCVATAPRQKTEMEKLFDAICMVESGNNPDAVNIREGARGCAQIRAVMVQDVNRILGKPHYRIQDCYDREKSFEMFLVFQKHYNKGASQSQMARCWNGGPSGHKKTATLNYWKKVKAELERQS